MLSKICEMISCIFYKPTVDHRLWDVLRCIPQAYCHTWAVGVINIIWIYLPDWRLPKCSVCFDDGHSTDAMSNRESDSSSPGMYLFINFNLKINSVSILNSHVIDCLNFYLLNSLYLNVRHVVGKMGYVTRAYRCASWTMPSCQISSNSYNNISCRRDASIICIVSSVPFNEISWCDLSSLPQSSPVSCWQGYVRLWGALWAVEC